MEFTKDFFLMKNSILGFGDMFIYLYICRSHSFIDRKIYSNYICIIDSLFVLGMVQINNVGWAILEQFSRKILLLAPNTICCTQVNYDYCVCRHNFNCNNHNGSRAHAANKRAWRWSRDLRKIFFFSRRWNIAYLSYIIFKNKI